MKKVKVKIPASTTNLGPGFDCLGLALQLYNTVELTRVKERRIIIDIKGEGEESLPKNKENIIIPALKLIFDNAGLPLEGIKIKEINNIPIKRGLGSSAATRLGGILGASALLEKRLTSREIIELATQLEGHPDNVAASLLGGLVTISYSNKEIKWLKMAIPVSLKVIVAIPELEISTEKARNILPLKIPLSDVIFNLSHLAILISSLKEKRWENLLFATEDKVHQPYRKALLPGMEEVFQAAIKGGARGVFLSGSGSTIAALSDKKEEIIGKAMQNALAEKKIKSRVMILKIDGKGAEVEE